MKYNNPHIKFCLEGSSSIFKELNQKDKESLVLNHSLYFIKRGELIFREGDKSHGLICLASGKAKVFKEGVGRREQILHMVKQHGFIGYQSLFSEKELACVSSSY